uniref:AlNc14C15G1702 protein n=1 Tax=Albugo laibachii Nc14 TaxID=890382 RepID=F0W408_9STRA|nr:AlNc14C15G1702 [Albugo laibachii Nc14]|eukprot:CCA15805.1 AlNc14C15G1702 [Albugo laibachii Nc14]
MGMEVCERSQKLMVLNHIAPSDVKSLSPGVGIRQMTTRSEPSEQSLDQYRNIVDDVESRVQALEARNRAMEAALDSMKQSHDALCEEFRHFYSETGI